MTQVTSHQNSTTTAMRAAVVQQPRQFAMADAPLPDIEPGQVRVRLQGCGVCASNIPPWEGRAWFDYPMAPGALGHEAWGWIDRVGQSVTDLKPGDRVAMMSGFAYAEYDVADHRNVVRLPASLADKPFPGEPLGCAMNILRRSNVEPGQVVAILGIGFLGSLLTQLCKARGATVIAISQRASSLDTARALGADHIIHWQSRDQVIQTVAKLTEGIGGYGDVKGWCDRVVECTGKQEALDLVGEITAVKGSVVIAGFHQDGPRSIDIQLWNWRGLNVINAHERDPNIYVQGIRDAISAIEQGHINMAPLLTHAFPLDQLDQALEAARSRPEGFIKAYVTMPLRTGEATP